MSKCRALQKKNEKSKSDLPVSQLDKLNDIRAGSSMVPEEYTPFISHGYVSFLDALSRKPITILRDTGASQSLILDGVLPFSSQSATGVTVLLQGVELGAVHVPLVCKAL